MTIKGVVFEYNTMSPLIETDVADQLTPEEAFHLLGHELRVKILWALWTAPDQTATFSELQDRLNVVDNGKLNYHRGKLTDHFIQKAPDSDGYTLRQSGLNIIQAIHAGIFTAHAECDPMPVSGSCADCSGQLHFRYIDDTANVFCSECDRLWVENAIPPATFAGRSDDELIATVVQRSRSRLTLAGHGVCPACSGRMYGELVRGSKKYFDHPTHVRYECDHCTFHPRVTLGESVLDHPAVISFFYEMDQNLQTIPSWDLPFCFDDHYIDLINDDPLRGQLRITLQSETLILTLSPTALVTDVHRRPRRNKDTNDSNISP